MFTSYVSPISSPFPFSPWLDSFKPFVLELTLDTDFCFSYHVFIWDRCCAQKSGKIHIWSCFVLLCNTYCSLSKEWKSLFFSMFIPSPLRCYHNLTLNSVVILVYQKFIYKSTWSDFVYLYIHTRSYIVIFYSLAGFVLIYSL